MLEQRLPPPPTWPQLHNKFGALKLLGRRGLGLAKERASVVHANSDSVVHAKTDSVVHADQAQHEDEAQNEAEDGDDAEEEEEEEEEWQEEWEDEGGRGWRG